MTKTSSTVYQVFLALLGSAILAFGLFNVHATAGITEGGILGLTLLLYNWLDISPSITGLILNAICYATGCKVLGKKFIVFSIVSGCGFSAFYAIFEQFEPLWPELVNHPLVAALVGALFVGIGVGLCVGIGGAPGGDDALAMSLSHITGVKIKWIYLISDLIVLGLSMSYIPIYKLFFSLITVFLSGQIISLVSEPIAKKFAHTG